MIVKIISGIETEKGLQNSLSYVDDPLKMSHDKEDNANMEENAELKRMFRYIQNEDKINGKYLSGYLCNPDTAFDEFMIAQKETMMKSGKKDSSSKYIAFHLVQSMPEGLEISDEEVHQCGIELVKKIGAHQAVIASHVNPVINEDTGEITGKCKHNHIIINAFMHPDKLDSRFPERIKFYHNKETYAKLQMWNDQIALEHGLPIIANPDLNKTYSWAELDAIKYNLSWKEHVRMDIDDVLHETLSWEEFVKNMEARGYFLHQGKHITYVTPEVNGEKKKVRDYKLGRAYTKDALLHYWKEKAVIEKEVAHEIEENTQSDEKDLNIEPIDKISKLFQLHKENENLYVGIPIGTETQERNHQYYLPLDTALDSKILSTYFLQDTYYNIYNELQTPIDMFYGHDIYNFILQKREKEEYEKKRNRDRDERMQKNKDRAATEKRNYYEYHLFINSRTKKPYRIGLYDYNGRRRTNLELMFILAAVVLQKEDKLWSVKPISQDQKSEIYLGRTDIKAQRMMDSIQMARKENIKTLSELDERLNNAGAQLSRTRAALNKNKKVKDKMDTLKEAVTIYQKTKSVAERIFHMPDGIQKEEELTRYEEEILAYNKAKSIMYRYQVKNDAEAFDVEKRYEQVLNNIARYEEKLIADKEEYRKLKKLKYNASLAEDPKYCYGPLYEEQKERLQNKKYSEKEERNNKK